MLPARARLGLAAVVVAVLAAAVYGNAVGGEFVFDDRPFLVDNGKLARGTDLSGYFRHGVWTYSTVADRDATLYRPLFLVFLRLNWVLWARHASGYHLFGVGLHVANSLLVLALLVRLLRSRDWRAPAMGAVLFALHPVHVEAVAWISAFVHLLVTLFLLVSFLLYLEHRQSGGRAPLAGAAASFGLALLTHEIAVTYPLIVLAWERIDRAPAMVRRLIAFALVLAGYVALRQLALGSGVPLSVTSGQGWGKAALLAAAYVRYLLVPWPQPLYLSTADDFLSPASIILAVGAIGGLVILLSRRPPGSALLGLATAWLAIALVPAIAAAFHPRQLFALRSLYLPSVAVAIYAAWLVAWPLRERRSVAVMVVAALALAGGGTIVVANRSWRNDGLVYSRILAASPREAGGHDGLARYLLRTGHEERAIRAFEAVVRYGRDEERATAYENLGLIFGKRGDVERSEAYYRSVLALAPGRSTAWVGLGNNAWQRGKDSEALEFYRRAYAADPANYEAVHNLALAYRRLGDAASAAYYAARARSLAGRAHPR